MPLNTDLMQILLHMLNLVILVGALALILYRPVVKFLRERTERLAAQEKETADKAAECDALKAEYEEKLQAADRAAVEKRLEAERESAQVSARYISEAQAKADAIVEAAEKDAESIRTHVLESAQTEIGELVLSATQKLLADQASPERDSALYDDFIRVAGQTAEKDDSHE
ncbi:MAG: ATP synthase F0 subunit B [Clostridia bacterium]|nr:ATP synthase F0 subunit B [Clostridia bacterium]